MGLLNRQDSTIFRKYFNEMCSLIGQSIGYQYITKRDMTIHSEDNSEFSMPISLNVLIDENPTVDTLTKYGWVSELQSQQPIMITMPYNTPHLAVGCRILLESVDGTPRPRLFKITKIASDLEYPDAYTCAIVPIFDQLPQRNQYTLLNSEKISEEDSESTSVEAPHSNISNSDSIDTVPREYKQWQDEYIFINNDNSPYSG